MLGQIPRVSTSKTLVDVLLGAECSTEPGGCFKEEGVEIQGETDEIHSALPAKGRAFLRLILCCFFFFCSKMQSQSVYEQNTTNKQTRKKKPEELHLVHFQNGLCVSSHCVMCTHMLASSHRDACERDSSAGTDGGFRFCVFAAV